MRRLIILHQGALGDFLLTIPVLEGIYQCQPDLFMDFWSRREHVALIASRPWVHTASSCEGPELLPFFHDDLWPEAPLPPFFQDAHAMVVFGQARSRILADRLSHRVPYPVNWIQSFPEAGEHPRAVSRFLRDQFMALGWPVQEVSLRVEPSHDERAAVGALLSSHGWSLERKPVLLHPGSGGRRKIWPLRNWWTLLHWLRSHHDGPILLSRGPADEVLEGFAREAAVRLGILCLEDLSLIRLSAFLSECRFYMGNDSGVSHLAAATGIPCLIVFGPTDPTVWAPRGEHVHLFQTQWDTADNLGWSPLAPLQPLDPMLMKGLEKILMYDANG